MAVSASDLERDEVDLGNGDDGRLYFDPTSLDVAPSDDYTLAEILTSDFVAPSVTTILNFRHDPEKDEAIDGWKGYYDGSSARRSPHWSDQQVYKQWRGTLAHYAVLSQLTDLERSDEEEAAEEGLRHWFRHAPQADVDDVPEDVLDAAETYWTCLRKGDDQTAARRQAEGGHQVDLKPWLSELDNQYDGVRAWERAMREVNTVCRLFEREVIDRKGLSPEDIVAAEEYVVVDEPVPYAGQADLVYEDRAEQSSASVSSQTTSDSDGDETVLADLKTSGKVRDGYKLQLGAYAHALPYDIDTVEVISIDPEDNEVAIERNDDWGRLVDSLYNEFLGLAVRTREVHLSDIAN